MEYLGPWFLHVGQPVRSGYYDTQRLRWDGCSFAPTLRLWWDYERNQWYTSPQSRNPLGYVRRWRGLIREALA